ncbi:MAG: hypothetical protein IKE33_04070 [Erysipelotrichaceae bacterium]|nr:hypothetical protein [Erysipelotrichaceae bacterium]
MPAITMDEETATTEPGMTLESQNETNPYEETYDPFLIEAENEAALSENTDGENVTETPSVSDTENEEDTILFYNDETDIIVSVVAPKGAFPEGTVMVVTPIAEEEVIDTVKTTLENDKVKKVKAVDITFYFEGEKIEPALPIKVSLVTDMIKEAKDTQIVHIDDQGEGSLVEQKTETETKDNEVVFESGDFSTYVVVETEIETTVITADGEKYNITVTYDESAMIPEGARLAVEEILPQDQRYQDYYDALTGELRLNLSYVRLFDISIMSNDQKVQPQTKVNVKIELDDLVTEENIKAVHIPDEGEVEVLDVEVLKETKDSEEKKAVEFEAEGFSIYAIVDESSEDHSTRVKYVFQNADGSDYMFYNTGNQQVNFQIVKNGESLEDVGIPTILDGDVFQGWYIYDSENDEYTGFKLTFGDAITIEKDAAATAITSTSVRISAADNQSGEGGENPDYVIYVRPYFGPVYYITFYNAVNDEIIYTKKQVPVGAQYNLAEEAAVPPDAIIDPETGEVTYVSYAFTGWSTEKGEQMEDADYIDPREEITDTVVTVNSDLFYYPIFRLSHWISFYSAPSGSGATYYPPKFILSGQTAEAAEPTSEPIWEGHSFVGWFTEPDGVYRLPEGDEIPTWRYDEEKERYVYDEEDGTHVFDDDYLSAGETDNGAFDFANTVISKDTLLYAHWNAGIANYTIIYWMQLSTDQKTYTDNEKNYEYSGQKNVIADVNSTVTAADAFEELKNVDGVNKTIGFMLNDVTSEKSTVVAAEGTSVINIYLDRKLIQLVFTQHGNQQGTYYTETTATTGTLYGYVNGQYIRLYSEVEPVTTWTYYPFNVNNNNNAYDVHGLTHGEYVPITRSDSRNYYNGEIYTGTRYNVATNNNTPQYGVVDGEVVQLERRGGWGNITWWYDGERYYDTRYVISNNGTYGFGSAGMLELQYGWTIDEDGTSYTGTRYTEAYTTNNYTRNRYTRNGTSYTNYTYTPTQAVTGTQYGVDDRGGHVLLIAETENQRIWKYTDAAGAEQIYTGTRYTQTTSNNTTVYTGLYGQTLEQNGYTWPQSSAGSWEYTGDGNQSYYLSYLGEFVLPANRITGANDTVTTLILHPESGSKRIYYYLQNDDGSWPGAGEYVDVGISGASSIELPDKYAGFTVDAYQRGNNGNGANSGTWTPGTAGETVVTNLQSGLGIRYRRLEYTFKFLDSRNGTPLTDENVQPKRLRYGIELSNADPGVSTLTPPTSQFAWDKHWYLDQEKTTIALFHNDLSREGELGNYTSINTETRTVTYGNKTYKYQVLGTMPAHDMSVYAGWEEIWYWVKLEPDGGVLTETEATWFWETLGQNVEEYHDVVRQYIEDEHGSWYYHYEEFDPATETNQYGTNSRKAYYTQDPTQSSDGKKYRFDPTAYSFVGWYEISFDYDEVNKVISNERVEGLYNFEGGVTGNTIIRALWRINGEYHVKYSAEGVDASGHPLYDDDGNRVTADEGTAPLDPSRYGDKSNSAMKTGITINPEGYTFLGWYYGGKVYKPGDVYLIQSELANDDKEIWIYPVFASAEELPVEITQIRFHGNGENSTTEMETTDEYVVDTSVAGDPTITKTPETINELVSIIGSDSFFTRQGYTFIGWAKEPNTTTPWLRFVEATEGETPTPAHFELNEQTIRYIAADNNDAQYITDEDGNIIEVIYNNDLYAIWEVQKYTVTVVKAVESSVQADKTTPFTFTPAFSQTDIPTEYQHNFSLTAEDTTITPASGEPISYTNTKVFENIEYQSTVQFTEANGDFIVSVAGEYTDDEGQSHVISDLVNGSTITINGDTTITFTNRRNTYDVTFIKEDMQGNPLSGANFLLSRNVEGSWIDYLEEDLVIGEHTVELIVGDYELKENSAPDGYIVMNNKIHFTIERDGTITLADDVDTTKVAVDQNEMTITVKNEPGAELPSTGGPGRAGYVYLGALLVAGSLMYEYSLRRRKGRR